MNVEQVKTILENNYNNIRGFHVKALYLFGSVVRGDAIETSDVDILVEFEPDAHIGLFEFARLQRMLSGLLGCHVDISTRESLHHALKEQILEEAIHAV
jgi:hypothetical protein